MRRFAVAFVLLFALQTLAILPVGATTQPVTPIQHVIIVMMENHSFDNAFGLYPTMNRTNPSPLLSSLQVPDDVLGAPKGVTLTQVPNGTSWTANPDEQVYSADWDNGKMDGFAANNGPQALTYFGPSQLAVEWDWAEEYAIGDRYFSSCLCMTNPNRLFSLSGYGEGLTTDSGPPPYIPANQSIFAELRSYGISWGYYLENPSASNFPLNYFEGIGAYSSGVQPWSSFYSALQDGNLPAVSWVMPVGGGALGVDQHPSYNVTYGQDWLLGVVDKVMQSKYWNSSAIFVNYDEGGGYYDHVPPPMLDGVQLGFRVPFFVISPYAKENYVSETVLNHASTLAFVDYNWGLPALNQYVADSGLPLDMFDFAQSYAGGGLVRQPVVLQNTSQYPALLQIPLADLPYQKSGSSALTLSSMGVETYVLASSKVAPLSEILLFVVAVAVVLIVVANLARKSPSSKVRGSQ